MLQAVRVYKKKQAAREGGGGRKKSERVVVQSRFWICRLQKNFVRSVMPMMVWDYHRLLALIHSQQREHDFPVAATTSQTATFPFLISSLVFYAFFTAYLSHVFLPPMMTMTTTMMRHTQNSRNFPSEFSSVSEINCIELMCQKMSL